jgi:hypothetical protein
MASLATRGLAALLLCVLAGCATQKIDYSQQPAAEVRGAVITADSEFDSSRSYVSPALKASGQSGGQPWFEYLLQAHVDKETGDTRYVATIVASYDGRWKFYRSASFPGGNTKVVTPLDSDVIYCGSLTCYYREILAIGFAKAELLAASQGDGLKIRLGAKNGDRDIIEYPAAYVAGFLAAVPVDRQ